MPAVTLSRVDAARHHKVDLLRAIRAIDDGPLAPAQAVLAKAVGSGDEVADPARVVDADRLG